MCLYYIIMYEFNDLKKVLNQTLKEWSKWYEWLDIEPMIVFIHLSPCVFVAHSFYVHYQEGKAMSSL